jgi:hypothetical protein
VVEIIADVVEGAWVEVGALTAGAVELGATTGATIPVFDGLGGDEIETEPEDPAPAD